MGQTSFLQIEWMHQISWNPVLMNVIPGSGEKTVALCPIRYNANLTIQIIPNSYLGVGRDEMVFGKNLQQ